MNFAPLGSVRHCFGFGRTPSAFSRGVDLKTFSDSPLRALGEGPHLSHLMSIKGALRFTRSFHRLAGVTLAICFAAALALAGSPQLHQRIHPGADHPAHQCAVNFLDTGGYLLPDATSPIVRPSPAIPLQNLLLLTPAWVSASFLGASIFEHAPPALLQAASLK